MEIFPNNAIASSTDRAHGYARLRQRAQKPHAPNWPPKYFYEVLSARSLDDGLLGRYLFIDADGFLPFAERTETPLPESVIAAAKMLIARESLIA